jgi:hypothetical protein
MVWARGWTGEGRPLVVMPNRGESHRRVGRRFLGEVDPHRWARDGDWLPAQRAAAAARGRCAEEVAGKGFVNCFWCEEA